MMTMTQSLMKSFTEILNPILDRRLLNLVAATIETGNGAVWEAWGMLRAIEGEKVPVVCQSWVLTIR